MKRLKGKNASLYIWQQEKWPCLSWRYEDLAEQLGRARFCQGKLISRVGSLGLALDLEAQALVLTEEAVGTSAIEGERLDRQSVRSSVARHLGLPTAGLPAPDRRADGLVDMLLDATVHYDEPLTPERVKGWHAALFPTGYSGLHRIRVGRWRGPEPMRVVSGPIGRETVHFEAPPSDRVEMEMKGFFEWWKESRGSVEGFIRAGVAHFYFVTIHPFEDGNGRVARALTDMALAQDENLDKRFYSLSSQIMAERDAYYEILERSQRGNCNITEWLSRFQGCSERAIGRSEVLISKILIKADFWRQHGEVSMSERQRKVVNRLLDAGPGGFEGGLSTRKYVSLAKVSRATAYREICDLVEKGILRASGGGGRSTSYDLVWPNEV